MTWALSGLIAALAAFVSEVTLGAAHCRQHNVRIDGLYFDQVWGLNLRLRQATNVRVDITAQGFPFPAPTCVVDYSVHRPGRDPSLSAFASADSYGALALEADASLPTAKDWLSLGLGGAVYCNSADNSTSSFQHIGAHRYAGHRAAALKSCASGSGRTHSQRRPTRMSQCLSLPHAV